MGEITKTYVGNYYEVIRDEGIFVTGQFCYIFSEEVEYLWASFQKPLIADINEIKISKQKLNDATVFRRISYNAN